MRRGYIKLWRKSFDSGLHKDKNAWLLWTYILCHVTHKEIDIHINGKTEHLMPGQMLTGLKVLVKETGLSFQRTRTCLEKLKKYENLTIKSTNKYSIISVVNWGIYQQDDETINTKSNKQLTNKQQTTNNKQECKEQKNVKNTQENIELPDWLDKDVWFEYKKYRKNGKSKFTDYAQGLAIKKLTKLKSEGNDPTKVLQQTIFRGWSGLFPLKDDDSQVVLKQKEITLKNMGDLYAN